MKRYSIRAAIAILLLMMMLPLAACPGKGETKRDGDNRSPTAPS
jgi:hypothetical protein